MCRSKHVEIVSRIVSQSLISDEKKKSRQIQNDKYRVKNESRYDKKYKSIFSY